MTATLTILGCGSSGGVPRIGNDWGQCDPQNPKNRRRRCSVLLTQSGAGGDHASADRHVARSARADAGRHQCAISTRVLYTHEHADHTHGIDELRAFYLRQAPARAGMGRRTAPARCCTSRFAYCFYTAPGSDYPPILNLNRLVPATPVDHEAQGAQSWPCPSRWTMAPSTRWAFGSATAAYTPGSQRHSG